MGTSERPAGDGREQELAEIARLPLADRAERYTLLLDALRVELEDDGRG